MEKEILERLLEVENRYKKMKRLFWGFLIPTLIAVFCFGFTKIEKFDIIRTKGIIIEDEKGRDRILIGPPIHFSKGRVETNSTKGKKYWANKFKNLNQYMELLTNDKNSTEGIIFINEDGLYIIHVADKLSDPNLGKKMFKRTEIFWFTQTGWKLNGIDVNITNDGVSRPIINLNNESGQALQEIYFGEDGKGIIIGGILL